MFFLLVLHVSVVHWLQRVMFFFINALKLKPLIFTKKPERKKDVYNLAKQLSRNYGCHVWKICQLEAGVKLPETFVAEKSINQLIN